MKYKFLCLISLIMCVCICGCGKKNSSDGIAGGYQIYYVNNNQTGVVTQPYDASGDEEALISEILKQLETPVDSIEYLCAKPENVELLDYSLEAEILKLKFDTDYLKMEKSTEVLMRMAYVETLLQISGVSGVEFYVEDEPLKNSKDVSIGVMNEDTFVENDGGEVNEYDTSEIILYYADKEGKELVQTSRKVTHSINMSLEKVVLEQLINGPSSNSDMKATMPKETKLLSISTNDGVCYVNLSSEFMELSNDVPVEVSVYSIVNSLAELPNVNKVQLSVYGVTNTSLSNNLNLGDILERNLDLVSKK